MLETVIGWLSGGLGSFIIGMVSRFLTDWLSDVRAAKAQKEAGRLQSERDNAIKTLEVDRSMADIAATPQDEDETLRRLQNGTG